jgi:AcrR family transcriptional regulator
VSPPRRPVQERARRRREAVLDAAARILDRSGWDALTTTAAAREAGCSVGAVYDYFPNQHAILEGLLERYEARLAARLILDSPEDLLTVADRAVDALASMWADEPGYRAAWLGTRLQARVSEIGQRWATRFGTAIAHRLGELAPGLAEDERLRVAFVSVHLVSGLLLAVVTAPEVDRAAGVAETKLALRAYLRARLPLGS